MHELNILLKIEFRRAFKNKLFAASIVIGLALAAGAFIQTVVPHIDVLGPFQCPILFCRSPCQYTHHSTTTNSCQYTLAGFIFSVP